MNRQRQWQLDRLASGRCPGCGRAAVPGKTCCVECGEDQRIRARNRYRIKHGIPLDAPVRRKVKLAILILFLAFQAFGRLPQAEALRYVSAIYKAEGRTKAVKPYGVLSVRVKHRKAARRVCYNTVQNTHDRWIRAGRPCSYLEFLADRYCPEGADPQGHRNWIKNVGHFTRR